MHGLHVRYPLMVTACSNVRSFCSRTGIHHSNACDRRSYTYVDGGLPDERLMELHAAKLGYVDYTGPISRCPGLITLEESLNTEPVVGACYHSKPLLPGLPTRYCEPLPCLWSYNLMTNIDVWLDAFSVLPDALLHGRCPVPEGGQAAQSKHIKPEVCAGIDLTYEANLDVHRNLFMLGYLHSGSSHSFCK